MKNKKILIIDDEVGFCQMMTNYLNSANYEAFAASNLEDAVILFKREKPKVVVLDFNMPIVNGDKFLPILQEMDPTVRVIVVSGFVKEEVEEKFKGLTYFTFFKKGDASIEEMKKKIDEAMNS